MELVLEGGILFLGEGFRITSHGLVYNGQPFGQGLEGPCHRCGTSYVPRCRKSGHFCQSPAGSR